MQTNPIPATLAALLLGVAAVPGAFGDIQAYIGPPGPSGGGGGGGGINPVGIVTDLANDAVATARQAVDDLTQPPPPPPPPEPANGGFESGGSCPPTDWGFYEYHSGTACVATSPVRSGSSSVHITDPSGSAVAGIHSECVPVSPGQSVTASAWHHADASGTGNFNLYLEFFGTTTPSGSGARIGVAWSGEPSTQSSWKPFSVAGTAPSGTVCAWVLLYHDIAASGGYYADDVTMSIA